MRYVVLEHTGHGDTHWDLMLEVPGRERLRTIQLSAWPLAMGESCAAKSLEPHRRVYLEYEGEVSGGRGSVRRVDRGTWEPSARGVNLQSDTGGALKLAVHEDRVEFVG